MSSSLRRKTPLVAKLGMATFISTSLVGFGGFLFHSVNKPAAQFLSLAFGSAFSAALVAFWTIRYKGVITWLPQEMEEPLLKWDLLQTINYMNSMMDVESFKLLLTELAPLALVKHEHESKRAIGNMSTEWQRVFSTKGLLGLLPPDIQRQLLPKNVPVVMPPPIPEGRSADINSQAALFRELAWLRFIEFRDDLATRSAFVRFLKASGEAIERLYSFIKQNTSSDLQVTVIMSVLVLLVIRVLLLLVLFVLRRVLAVLYLI